MTFPDNKYINSALRLEEKVDPDKWSKRFIPIGDGRLRLYSQRDLESALEKSFNERKLTSFEQIAEEFNAYHLPCKKGENKLICEYYVVRSTSGPFYFLVARSDIYTVISLTFEKIGGKISVKYSNQYCYISYNGDNTIKNYAQINAERGRIYDDAEYLDARTQKCLHSELYKKMMNYFKTYYPKKYDKAHLGGRNNE